MCHIVDNFKLGDLVYGLQEERKKITSLLNSCYPDSLNMLTIDKVNPKIVYPTIQKMKLTLDMAEELGCLSVFGLSFFNYLRTQQNTPKFIEVMQKTKQSDGEDDNYLTRYNCQRAINYVLSEQNKEETHIHFILDGIDINQALREIDKSKSSFTSAEIREIARNIENPKIANKIFFYRNNQQVDFVTIKEEFRSVMAELGKTTIDLQQSPIKMIAKKETLRDKKSRSTRKPLSNKLLFNSLTPNSYMDGLVEPARLFAGLSVQEYHLCDKLNNWTLDQQNLSASLTQLYSILNDINITLIKEHIENFIVRREEIRFSLMQMMKQFAEREALEAYNNELKTGNIDVSLQQLRATYLCEYKTVERFNAYVTEQLITNQNDYLSLMYNLFELVGEIDSSSSSSNDLQSKGQMIDKKLFINIKELCKLVFSVPTPFSSILFSPKTPPLQYTSATSLPICAPLDFKTGGGH